MIRSRPPVACWLLASLLLPGCARAQTGLPPQITRQLPPAYQVIGTAHMNLSEREGDYYVVALGKRDEERFVNTPAGAPARALLLFARRPDGSYAQAGRNDRVVLRRDEGGQCDPFLDSGGVIAVKGRYFTVENGVACGQHWTDYVTFRFDHAAGRFVFDNERTQSWSMNPSTAPDAEALVQDGPQQVRRGNPHAPVSFDDWRPAK